MLVLFSVQTWKHTIYEDWGTTTYECCVLQDQICMVCSEGLPGLPPVTLTPKPTRTRLWSGVRNISTSTYWILRRWGRYRWQQFLVTVPQKGGVLCYSLSEQLFVIVKLMNICDVFHVIVMSETVWKASLTESASWQVYMRCLNSVEHCEFEHLLCSMCAVYSWYKNGIPWFEEATRASWSYCLPEEVNSRVKGTLSNTILSEESIYLDQLIKGLSSIYPGNDPVKQ
jgi:hypothetical protein